MNLQLSDYLKRINYHDTLRPDLETLIGLHRAHLLNISYENLDIHRDCPLTVDIDAIFRKIVTDRRGGWCFEMNGLFGWALREIGFDVTLLSSTVGRGEMGRPVVEGTHLILLVQLDRPYLADVGFGNGVLEPIPLEVGTYRQGFLEYALRLDGDRWWFENQEYGGAGFDFTLKAHDLNDFAPMSHFLQTSPDSGFVRTTVCHRFTADGFVTLRGATLRRITQDGAHEQVIETLDAYHQTLENVFDLHLDDVGALWDKVWARHLVWVQTS